MGDEAGDCKDERSSWADAKKTKLKRSGGQMWVMRQMTSRMRAQDRLTKSEKDERSGGSVAKRQRGRKSGVGGECDWEPERKK